jgi:uncharacterized protein YndB with AHSA1/START domain
VRSGLALDERWVLRAPRERVFEALTDPTALARWWGPAGFTLPEVELDLTVGGSYRFGMQPPEGDLFHLEGEFVEVERPRLLVYTFRWEPPDPEDQETTVWLSLVDFGGATGIALLHGDFLTDARLALHANGWRESIARLSHLVEPQSLGARFDPP